MAVRRKGKNQKQKLSYFAELAKLKYSELSYLAPQFINSSLEMEVRTLITEKCNTYIGTNRDRFVRLQFEKAPGTYTPIIINLNETAPLGLISKEWCLEVGIPCNSILEERHSASGKLASCSVIITEESLKTMYADQEPDTSPVDPVDPGDSENKGDEEDKKEDDGSQGPLPIPNKFLALQLIDNATTRRYTCVVKYDDSINTVVNNSIAEVANSIIFSMDEESFDLVDADEKPSNLTLYPLSNDKENLKINLQPNCLHKLRTLYNIGFKHCIIIGIQED